MSEIKLQRIGSFMIGFGFGGAFMASLIITQVIFIAVAFVGLWIFSKGYINN